MDLYVLITRPAEDALEVAREVEARGFTPFIEPLLIVQKIPFAMPKGYDALVFTSANAVRVAAEATGERRGPVYTVGDHTAEVARACGWGDVRSAGGDAASLMRLLAGEGFSAGARLVHLSGTDVSRNIEVTGLRIERRAVYRAEKATALTPACRDIMDREALVAALFFSARTAEAFAELLEREGCTQSVKATKALCLADSVVECLRHLPWRDVQEAQSPDRQALLALLDKV